MIEDIIAGHIKEPLNNVGYDVLLINYNLGKRRANLQIFIECLDGKIVGIDDCEKASHIISLLLDTYDPIKIEYNLEVSSPGIDRPLVRMADYEKFKGHEAKITIGVAMSGRRNFTGVIRGTKDEDKVIVYLADKKQEVEINFYNIQKAKLILTNKLIKAFSNNDSLKLKEV